jgi:hypothetical protein
MAAVRDGAGKQWKNNRPAQILLVKLLGERKTIANNRCFGLAGIKCISL